MTCLDCLDVFSHFDFLLCLQENNILAVLKQDWETVSIGKDLYIYFSSI